MRKPLTTFLVALFLGMMVLPMVSLSVNSANLPQPQPLVSWVIANESWFGMPWFQPADGDDITVNSGGIVHCNWNWTGADGSRDLSGIIVNLGGIFIQHNGTRIDINTATSIVVNEGGQWRSLGTSISRCDIKGESTTSNTHYITTNLGGKFLADCTDIDHFYFLYAHAGMFSFYNSTITDVQYMLYQGINGGRFDCVNCSIDSTTANRYCLTNGASASFMSSNFIDCEFTSTTDNYLFSTHYIGLIAFAGCTYQGIAIATDDFPTTTCDYDIRIYEASTIITNIASVSVSAWHPSIDEYGLLYDRTSYLKISGYLSHPRTNGEGNVTLYLLNRSGYWRSGLAVGNREWVNWSQGADAEASDNQQWNITVSKLGYLTNYTIVWSGTNATIELEPEPLERANQTIRTYSTNITVPCNYSSRFAYADIVYGNGTITFAHDITNVNVNVSIENESGIWVTDLIATATQSFSADTMINLTEINGGVLNWTPTEEGQLYMKLNTWKDNEVDNFNTTEDFLIQNESPASPGPGSASGHYTPPTPIYPSPIPAANETWLDLQWVAFGLYIANNQAQMIFLTILLIAGILIYGSTKKKKKKPGT